MQKRFEPVLVRAVDSKIKDRCHAQAVDQSGFDPNSPDNPSRTDYQKQHFEAVAQGLVEEALYPRSISRHLQRQREWSMRDSLKAQSDRAQTYVRAYRSCLETTWRSR